MKRALLVCCFSVLLCGHGLGQTTKRSSVTATKPGVVVKDGIFCSLALQREMHYRILLPQEYAEGGRFPVLYLLHGLYGDYQNWATRTGVENYARGLHLLIVMPDAADSWYTNSATIPADKFEDYIVKDLIPEVDQHYSTVRDRHARAIAGLSMGGFGAVKLALKYPELFAFAGSLSGAFNAPQDLDELRPEFRAKLVEVFGNKGNSTRAENDISRLLGATRQAPLPYFYVACGASDFFLDVNRALIAQLTSRHMVYEYHETSGGHTWEYWDQAVQPMLQVVARTIGGARSDVGKK